MAEDRFAQAQQLVNVAGWIFISAGGLMVLGGLVLAIDDPAGFFLVLFGLVFGGAGYGVKKLFSTPAGKKAVVLSAQTVATGAREATSATIAYVDEDATAAEVDQIRRDHLRGEWAAQEDWAAGLVQERSQRMRGMLKAAVVAFWLFAAVAGGAAALWGDIAWLVLIGAAGMAIMLTVALVRGWLLRRKFGESVCELAVTPVAPGEWLRGRVHTGVPQTMRPKDDFQVHVRCINVYETTRTRPGDPSDRRTELHSDVLWETERREAGTGSSRNLVALAVPVELELPASIPPGMLGRTGTGVHWELEVRARLTGLDYLATFRLPVLPPEVVAVLREP